MLMPIRSDLFKSINRNFPYLSRGFIVILTLVVIVTSELSVSTTWSAAPSAIPSTEVVNRAHKGDRLLLPRIERAERELPVGCESVVSSLVRSPLTHVARACLS
jgi:hypothetical protein